MIFERAFGLKAFPLGLIVALQATAGLGQVTLKPDYPEGLTVEMENRSKVDQTLTIGPQAIATKAENSTTATSIIGRRGPDGMLPINSKIDSVRVALSLPGNMSFRYDSSDPDADTGGNAQLDFLKDAFESVKGIEYTVSVGKDNRAVSATIKGSPLEGLTPMARQLVEDQIDPDNLKSMLNQELEKLPAKPVTAGDSWTRKESIPIGSGQTLSLDVTYTYAGTVDREGETLDHITAKTDSIRFSMDPNSPSPLKVSDSQLDVVASEGELLFDRELGLILESRQKFHVTGDMTFQIAGADLPGKLDLTLELTASSRPKTPEKKPE